MLFGLSTSPFGCGATAHAPPLKIQRGGPQHSPSVFGRTWALAAPLCRLAHWRHHIIFAAIIMTNAQLPSFYAPQLAAGHSSHQLNPEAARHALQVLRMQVGQALLLTNGQGLLAQATIQVATKKECTLSIGHTQQVPHSASRPIAIAISPVKNASRFEWFVEKATELGVAHIFPLQCQRTVGAHFRLDRLQGVAISAMLQSQQAWLPTLHQPMGLAQVLAQPFPQKLLAHCLATGTKSSLASHAAQPSPGGVLLLVGPEGDFTPAEIEMALAAGCQAISLGNTRLRTETAGVVGASVLSLV
ncbi:MAG: 16S rRNA (uracil(1498)-N(3))-methyltransferase [Bacteroidetes bacterium]|nr:MAG: 16S rRNA (uracil(1498)-N(3))-methyltransferase [Bacteroidota bacterium]